MISARKSRMIAMWCGYVFLYIPIFILIAFSFNGSKLMSVWGGFSVEHYRRLWADHELVGSALISLQVASASATCAVLLGTLAALSLVRFGLFKGRTIFTGLLASPFIMPEVITGFSVLLLFISLEQWIGWPDGRSVITIILAHTTLGMAYVAVIVQARLSSMDCSLEEAAADLGAKPLVVFFRITVPMILPALIAGWLLAFTLSIDDLVIASFTSGPGSSTLPMLIYSRVRLGLSPEINALATLIMVFVTVSAGLASLLTMPRRHVS
jgi:putrescine transport system permease protein